MSQWARARMRWFLNESVCKNLRSVIVLQCRYRLRILKSPVSMLGNSLGMLHGWSSSCTIVAFLIVDSLPLRASQACGMREGWSAAGADWSQPTNQVIE
jgi:hypothetical protein